MFMARAAGSRKKNPSAPEADKGMDPFLSTDVDGRTQRCKLEEDQRCRKVEYLLLLKEPPTQKTTITHFADPY